MNKGPDISFHIAKGQKYLVLWDGDEFVDLFTYNDEIEIDPESAKGRKLRGFVMKVWERLE